MSMIKGIFNTSTSTKKAYKKHFNKHGFSLKAKSTSLQKEGPVLLATTIHSWGHTLVANRRDSVACTGRRQYMLPSSITHEPQKQHSVNYRVIILLQHPYASTVSVMGRTASNCQQYVCVSETISRQPTDCIDRSMRTVGVATTKRIWSAVCRPALAHACISYVGRTRAQVCRGAMHHHIPGWNLVHVRVV